LYFKVDVLGDKGEDVMKIRFYHTLALLCCAGVTAAMAGCAPEETGAITEDGEESAAVATDGVEQPALQPETWNGQCCWWTCTNYGNEHRHSSDKPTVYGSCQDYARYWCKQYIEEKFKEGSADWNACK
jgi:hypothetical protein